jgi:cytochrome P450
MTSITDSTDARRVLADPRFRVPEADASPGPFGSFRADVSRFTNGPVHDERRRRLEAMLGELDLERLARIAATRTAAMAAHAGSDVALIARHVPVATIAHELGFAAPDTLPSLVAAVATVYPSGLASDAADDAVLRLLDAAPRSDHAGRSSDAVLRVQLLVQSYTATATLIETAMRRLDEDAHPSRILTEDLVIAVLRDEPPVRTTKRIAPDRAVITVHLDGPDRAASADTGSLPLAFGAGPRRCPAPAHAIAIAVAVIDELRVSGAC